MKIRAVVVLGFALAASACDSSGGERGPSEPLTYYQDVKPLIDAKCVKCHVDGGIAPMDLRTYEAIREYLGREPELMGELVSTHEMPPWPPNNDCATYVGDRSLTQAQIDTIVGWLDGGALEGDPAREGEALADNAGRLSREDLTLSMPVAFTPTLEPDEYRCFLLPWPAEYTTTRYVTGFRADPAARQVVHHILAYTAAPDRVTEF